MLTSSVPESLGTEVFFIINSAVVSVLNSWYSCDRLLKQLLQCTEPHYQFCLTASHQIPGKLNNYLVIRQTNCPLCWHFPSPIPLSFCSGCCIEIRMWSFITGLCTVQYSVFNVWRREFSRGHSLCVRLLCCTVSSNWEEQVLRIIIDNCQWQWTSWNSKTTPTARCFGQLPEKVGIFVVCGWCRLHARQNAPVDLTEWPLLFFVLLSLEPWQLLIGQLSNFVPK